MLTKQSIHGELDNFKISYDGHGNFLGICATPEQIKSFYDLKIQELLEGIVPKEWVLMDNLSHGDLRGMGFNQAISDMKENIQKAGFNLK